MKAIIISIIIALSLIFGAFMFTRNNVGTKEISSISGAAGQSNVSIVDGKQIITISAKGGYQPRQSTAKAGIPTILRFDTNGTFDCSSYVRIPSLDITKALPQSGTTDIDIGSPEAKTLQGMCGMGMYRFEVDFKG